MSSSSDTTSGDRGRHKVQYRVEQKGQWKQESSKILQQSLTRMKHATHAECLQRNPEIPGCSGNQHIDFGLAHRDLKLGTHKKQVWPHPRLGK